MSTIEDSINISVPVRMAYNQWTQFEEFPKFMDDVEEVRQLDDTHLHWKVKIDRVEREFETEITEQRPDERIAWRSTSGTGHSGVVSFESTGPSETCVTLRIETEPHGLLERAGDVLGVPGRHVRSDLERFRELIERRGHESGGWRGEVPDGGARPEGVGDEGGGRFGSSRQRTG